MFYFPEPGSGLPLLDIVKSVTGIHLYASAMADRLRAAGSDRTKPEKTDSKLNETGLKLTETGVKLAKTESKLAETDPKPAKTGAGCSSDSNDCSDGSPAKDPRVKPQRRHARAQSPYQELAGHLRPNGERSSDQARGRRFNMTAVVMSGYPAG
jgi:hypothetical protein